MYDKKLITEYVERVFDLYGLNKLGFFYDLDDESDVLGDFFVTPLFVDGYESEEETIQRVSLFLGLTPEEIINRDKRAALRYWDKYPYFELHDEFVDAWVWNARYRGVKPTAEELIISRLFDVELVPETRYDFARVEERLDDRLKEAAKFHPIYYPPNSKLHIIRMESQEMFSFPKCGELIRAFLDMVYRVQNLFFKALDNTLSEEEQREYNFLVSFFNITDIVCPSTKLYYHEVVRLRDVLLDEGYHEFWSYAKIRSSLVNQQPWRCIEFFDDRDLVQEFVNSFPESKKMMIEFSRLVKNFRFTFQWEIIKSQEEKDEEFVRAYLAGEDYNEDLRFTRVLTIYVEKTDDEVADFEEGLELLRSAASPPAKGGLKLPKREYKYGKPEFLRVNISRIQHHVSGR